MHNNKQTHNLNNNKQIVVNCIPGIQGRHRGPPSIEVMKLMKNLMFISDFSSRVPSDWEKRRLMRSFKSGRQLRNQRMIRKNRFESVHGDRIRLRTNLN